MMVKLNAIARLKDFKSGYSMSAVHTNLDKQNGEYGGDEIGKFSHDFDLVDAAFDNSRDLELRNLLPLFAEKHLPYYIKESALMCRVPIYRGHVVSKQTVQILQEAGINLYMRDNPLAKNRFAIRAANGLVYQRLDVVHRIFFTRG